MKQIPVSMLRIFSILKLKKSDIRLHFSKTYIFYNYRLTYKYVKTGFYTAVTYFVIKIHLCFPMLLLTKIRLSSLV